MFETKFFLFLPADICVIKLLFYLVTVCLRTRLLSFSKNILFAKNSLNIQITQANCDI